MLRWRKRAAFVNNVVCLILKTGGGKCGSKHISNRQRGGGCSIHREGAVKLNLRVAETFRLFHS